MTKRVISGILAAGLVAGTIGFVGCEEAPTTPPAPPTKTAPAVTTDAVKDAVKEGVKEGIKEAASATAPK